MGEQAMKEIVLGQYGPSPDGLTPGYRSETGVAPDSRTPTFAAMRLFVDNWRWQGVPFMLRTGKRLAEPRTEVVVHFRPVPIPVRRRSRFQQHPAESADIKYPAD